MKSLNKLYSWYETLTIESLENFKDFYAEDAFFKDPFNEVLGHEKIRHIFKDMFHQLDNPRFIFIDKIEQGSQAFVTWDFVFAIRQKTYTIRGSSHLKFNDDLLIVYHRDYWDVGEELLLKVPLIKNLYGAFRKKISST